MHGEHECALTCLATAKQHPDNSSLSFICIQAPEGVGTLDQANRQVDIPDTSNTPTRLHACALLFRRMASDEPAPFPLLALPNPCLVVVLQQCGANDQRSLFSAARAHSRLHQAAAAALHSITATVPDQQRVESVMLYLSKYSPRIDSLNLTGEFHSAAGLVQLPPNLRPSSLQLSCLNVQLMPGNGFQGVLGAADQIAALTELRLNSCKMIVSTDDLPAAAAAALSQLPAGLQHLSI
jgi:hypothetical protein